MQPGPLSRPFLAAAAPEVRAAHESSEALEPALRRLLTAARARWPEVTVPSETFVQHLAARVPSEGLSALHADDLYLACACELGDAVALAAFERSFMVEVKAFVAHLRTDATFLDELRQRLREKLLFASGATRAGIAEYSGRGALGAWLRVVAVRTALNLLRQVDAAKPLDPALRLAASDPELRIVKAADRAQLAEALRAALAAVGPDERTMLRLHYLEGTTMEDIAALFHLHKSSVSRALARARELILTETRRRLAEQLMLAPPEVDSLIQLAESQLEVSLKALLG